MNKKEENLWAEDGLFAEMTSLASQPDVVFDWVLAELDKGVKFLKDFRQQMDDEPVTHMQVAISSVIAAAGLRLTSDVLRAVQQYHNDRPDIHAEVSFDRLHN